MLFDLVVTLAGIAFVNVLGWLSPGPNTLAIISSAVSKGRRAGVATAFGISMGGAVWVVLAMAGAAVVFELFPKAVFLMRMLGAGYLLWLGVTALRAALAGEETPLVASDAGHSGWQAFRTGFLVNLTNPKAMIFFSSVFAAFIPANAPVWVLVVIVVFSQAQAFAQHCITVWVFSSQSVVRRFRAASRMITSVIGALYCGLGAGVAADAMRRVYGSTP